MKKVKLFESFISELVNEDKIQNALGNIDKWMPEDPELQDEYYELISAGDVKGMEEFLDMYADEDGLMKYGIKYQDLGKLAKAIVKESVNEAKNKGPWIFYVADDSILKSPQFKNNAGYVKDMGKNLGVNIKAINQESNAINQIVVKELGSSIDKACYVSSDNYNELMSHAKVAMARGIKFAKQGDFILDPTVLESVAEAAETAVNQFAKDEQADGYDAKVFLGKFDGTTFKAQSTNKTWDDGVPVTKNFSRGGFKDVKLKGEYQLVDSDRGWWYIQGPANTWYAVKHSDYGTPPFEY